jgi:leucyl/phenylalanyl-tRNA--protein transferase
LTGYRRGLFAMNDGDRLVWWSPDPRGVLHPAAVHVSRSMNRIRNRLTVSIDRRFGSVLSGCADPRRPDGWITADYRASYLTLHELGWAHSVEVWDDDLLVAGLFGVQVGGLFAAESMFHDPRYGASASRLAVIALCDALHGSGSLIDVQWRTPHLARVGVSDIPRGQYLALLPEFLARPGALAPARIGAAGKPILAPTEGSAQPGPPGGGPNRIRWVTGP